MRRHLVITIVLICFLFVGNAFAQQSDAELELRTSTLKAVSGDEFEVDVFVKNPGLQKVISVRSWLEYSPSALEAISIDTDNTSFTLSAPGEDEFDPQTGRVMIGRSNIKGGMADAESKVATVKFRVKTKDPVTTVIAFHDYQVNELGHTSVNIIDEGFPINILSEEPEELRIQLNDGASGSSDDDAILPGDIGGAGMANLARPQNLRVNTGTGYVDLRWDMGLEDDLSGYNIYYGKTSGNYTRRRSVGKVSEYRLDGLNNNEVYYFAVTAYDNIDRESDYSDEVAVIVGQPLSSTAPFEELLNSLLGHIPFQPQNGPMTWWLLISAAGFSWIIVTRKRRA